VKECIETKLRYVGYIKMHNERKGLRVLFEFTWLKIGTSGGPM
jgi:hypothetical protein